MNVITLCLPPFQTNCYILYLTEGGSCIVIDPASNEKEIINKIEELSLTPSLIFLTHGHFDHIGAVDALRERYGTRLAIHESDASMLSDASLNASTLLIGQRISSGEADLLLSDGNEIMLEAESLTVMNTPGHTPGSSILIGKEFIISGDTLFRSGYGRYDLAGGNAYELFESLKKILSLDEALIVYPGHGEKTTIKREKTLLAF